MLMVALKLISWDASLYGCQLSRSLNSKIEYEIFVIYPDNRMGPYRTEKTSYQFDYLNADKVLRWFVDTSRFARRAVGTSPRRR